MTIYGIIDLLGTPETLSLRDKEEPLNLSKRGPLSTFPTTGFSEERTSHVKIETSHVKIEIHNRKAQTYLDYNCVFR